MADTTNRSYPKPDASEELIDDVVILQNALDQIDTDIHDLVTRTQEIVTSESPAFSGTPTSTTAPANDVSARIATTQFVQNAIAAIGGFVTSSTLTTTLAGYVPLSSTQNVEIGQQLKLQDDNGEDDFVIRVDGDVLSIQTDIDGDAVVDGPNPFELNNATSLAYAYGERLVKYSELDAITKVSFGGDLSSFASDAENVGDIYYHTNGTVYYIGAVGSPTTLGAWQGQDGAAGPPGANAVASIYRATISSGMAANGLLTLAHGLGGDPDFVNVAMRFKVAYQNNSVGDEVLLSNAWASDAGDARGLRVDVDGSYVRIRIGSQPTHSIQWIGNNGARNNISGSQMNTYVDLIVKAIRIP